VCVCVCANVQRGSVKLRSGFNGLLLGFLLQIRAISFRQAHEYYISPWFTVTPQTSLFHQTSNGLANEDGRVNRPDPCGEEEWTGVSSPFTHNKASEQGTVDL